MVLAVFAVGALVIVAVTVQRDDDSAPSEASDGAGDEEGGDGVPGDADGEGASGSLESWTTPANEGINGEVVRTLTTGSDLVVVTQRDITSIDRETGEQSWRTKWEDADGPDFQVVTCGAGTTASEDGMLAVTLGFDDDPEANFNPFCGMVAVVDLATGNADLSTEVDYVRSSSSGEEGMPVEIIGDTVAATGNQTILGLDVADLSTRWQWDVDSVPGREGLTCSITDMALGDPDQLVVLSYCITDRGDYLNFVDEVGIAGGDVGRSYEITEEGAEDRSPTFSLVSASPVVIQLNPGATTSDPNPVGSIIALDDSWNVSSTIHDEERTALESDDALMLLAVGDLYSTRFGYWRRPSRALASGDTLVAFTTPNEGSENELVAVDLSTGENIWETGADGFVFWQVLAVEDETIVALAASVDNSEQAVVTVDLSTGEIRDEATTEVTQPSGQPGGQMGTIGYVYADGRAYAVDFDDAGKDGERWMAYTVG